MLWGLHLLSYLHPADWFQKTGPILAQLPRDNSSHECQIFFRPCYSFSSAAILMKMLSEKLHSKNAKADIALATQGGDWSTGRDYYDPIAL